MLEVLGGSDLGGQSFVTSDDYPSEKIEITCGAWLSTQNYLSLPQTDPMLYVYEY